MPERLFRRLLLAFGLLALAAATGCYTAPDDRTKARLRLINASEGYATLDLELGGKRVQSGVAYGGSAGYADVDPDQTTSALYAGGSASALLNFTSALTRDKHHAVLAFGRAGSLRQLALDENQDKPANGRTKLRVVNAAPDAGALDIYITAAGDALTGAVPVQAGAAYGALGSAVEVASGTWRLRVAAANSKTDVRLDIADLALGSAEVAVLVLTPSAGGTLVNALYVVQQGGIAQLGGSKARLRVVAGVTQAGAVSAAVGGITLMDQVASPALQTYALVSAGTPPLNASVNGNSVGPASLALQSGRDYTLLVLGLPATPSTALLEDANPPPSAAGTARLRLVNVVTGVANPASLKVGLQVLASGVAAAAASDYLEVAAASSTSLLVEASGQASPLFSAADQELLAGGKYSLFVIGAPGAITGVLVKDR